MRVPSYSYNIHLHVCEFPAIPNQSKVVHDSPPRRNKSDIASPFPALVRFIEEAVEHDIAMVPTTSRDDSEAMSVDTTHNIPTLISDPLEPIISDFPTRTDTVPTIAHIPVTSIDPTIPKVNLEPSSSMEIPMQIEAEEIVEEPVGVGCS